MKHICTMSKKEIEGATPGREVIARMNERYEELAQASRDRNTSVNDAIEKEIQHEHQEG